MSIRTVLACCISKIWQYSSWTKRWNSLSLQLVTGNQQLTAPLGSLSPLAELTGRSPRKGNRSSTVSANACQMHGSCRTSRWGCCAADPRTSSGHAGREAGSGFAFSVFLAVSGTSDILTILLTSTGDTTALLCTKAGSMCLKRRLQNSASFKTHSFQRLLAFVSSGQNHLCQGIANTRFPQPLIIHTN